MLGKQWEKSRVSNDLPPHPFPTFYFISVELLLSECRESLSWMWRKLAIELIVARNLGWCKWRLVTGDSGWWLIKPTSECCCLVVFVAIWVTLQCFSDAPKQEMIRVYQSRVKSSFVGVDGDKMAFLITFDDGIERRRVAFIVEFLSTKNESAEEMVKRVARQLGHFLTIANKDKWSQRQSQSQMTQSQVRIRRFCSCWCPLIVNYYADAKFIWRNNKRWKLRRLCVRRSRNWPLDCPMSTAHLTLLGYYCGVRTTSTRRRWSWWVTRSSLNGMIPSVGIWRRFWRRKVVKNTQANQLLSRKEKILPRLRSNAIKFICCCSLLLFLSFQPFSSFCGFLSLCNHSCAVCT